MKKFLSLVLALIMTMSLVTIGAGATEYRDLTDKDEIQYEEAVAVLNRIGVITGYEDGSFRPETELTRGAAAKIIVSLLIGPEAASNLPNATAPYPDVPASHTFAGVISYCKTAGIISGYGDGTFKPGNSLTGFAFAKMLLGALGYKSEIEGFVDTGWTMNVAKVGNVTGLFDRLDFDGSAAVNREEACQLALNTLKATMVTYGGTTLVTGNQNLAVANTQAMYVTSNNREINANINRRVISAANNEMTLEFGEEHFKDLRLEHDKYDPAYDDFGHPSNEWSYKKVTIGTFKLPADFTYTTQVAYREDSAATKEKALGLRGYDTYSTDHRASSANWSTASSLAGLNGFGNWNSPFADATQITINGWNSRIYDASYNPQTPTPALSELDKKAFQDGTQYSYDAGTITAATKDQAPSLSEIADLTDNGVTVEVYVCPVDADFITNVVVTRTQLMKVDRIGSDYVSLERISPDSRDPRRTPTTGLADITGYNAFSVDVDVVDVKDSNYDPYNVLKDLKAGDRVAVVPFTPDEGKTWEVGEAYVPETVSGRLSDVGLYMNTSKRDGNAVSITIGGTKYIINEWNLDMIDVKKPQIDATRKDITGYLAKDGTVLWANEIGNSDAWMIVGDYYQATNSSGKVVWFVHGWTIGGEEVDVDLGTIRNEAEKYAPGELVHYDLSNGTTGEYELSKPNANRNSRKYSDGTVAFQEPSAASEKTGEGVYNVAQYVKTASNPNAVYEIHPSNSLIPLERYKGTDVKKDEYTANGGAIFANEKDAAGNYLATANSTLDGHTWNYRSTTYKDTGVKFIYVSFSPVTGEVDYISVRNGVQSVEPEELAYQNTIWNNTATHSVVDSSKTWVISPAEAYVNDEGHVEAVVIKSEPTVADLSNVVIVGKVVGNDYGKSTGAEEVSALTNVRTREYWQGPNFSEKKTGSFKNQHNTGDILVIRSTDSNGVMDCKSFNSGLYGNRNPDVIWAKNVAKLTSATGDDAKIAFYIGKNSGLVWDQSGNSISTKTSDGKADNWIMTDKKTEADSLLDLSEFGRDVYKGLVKVTSSTKWLDLREEEWGHDVRNLSDLYDLDLTTVEIKVLLNGNDTSDGFRSAYAIAVLNGKPKTETPDTTTTGSVRPTDAYKAGNWDKYSLGVNGTPSLSVTSTGYASWNFSIKAPAWVAANTTADISYEVWSTKGGTSTFAGVDTVEDLRVANGVFTVARNSYLAGIFMQPDQDGLQIRITDIKYGAAKVQYYAGTGSTAVLIPDADVTAAKTLSCDVTNTTGASAAWPVVLNSNWTVASAAKAKISGANVDEGDATAFEPGTDNDVFDNNDTSFYALGGDYVKIYVTTAAKAPTTYSIAPDLGGAAYAGAVAQTGGSAASVADFGATGYNSTLLVAWDAASYNPGATATITATLADAGAGPVKPAGGYIVTIVTDGGTYELGPAVTGALTKTIQMTGNLKITGVSVKAAPSLADFAAGASATSAVVAKNPDGTLGDTMRITFNVPVCNGTADNAIAATTGMTVAGSNPAATVSGVTHTAKSATIEVKINRFFQAGDILTFASANVPIKNNAVVADGFTANLTLTVAADGSVTVAGGKA